MAMLLIEDRGFVHPIGSDITPQSVFNTRRRWLAAMGAVAALGPRAAWPQASAAAKSAPLPGARSAVPGAITMDKQTPLADATSYNNFYEFGTDKSDPAQHAHTLKTRPWTVAIEGEVKKPLSLGI